MSECTLCSDIFNGVERMMAAPCGHVFHAKCLPQWVDRENTCPVCKRTVSRAQLLELFFNVTPPEDLNTTNLCNELETIKTLLQEKYMEANDISVANSDLQRTLQYHESKISALDEEHKGLHFAIRETMESNVVYREDIKRMTEEKKVIESEIHFLEFVKTFMAGTSEHADKLFYEAVDMCTPDTSILMVKYLAFCCSFRYKQLRQICADKDKVAAELASCKKNLNLTTMQFMLVEHAVEQLEKKVQHLENVPIRKFSQNSYNRYSGFKSKPYSIRKRSPKKVSGKSPVTVVLD